MLESCTIIKRDDKMANHATIQMMQKTTSKTVYPILLNIKIRQLAKMES